LIKIIREISIKVIDIESYICLFGNYKDLFKGIQIRKELEETFNVSISFPVFRNFNEEHKEKGRGGFRIEPNRNIPD
jgi:hypothetical protein